ncbi:MAG: DeoR/GlpR family DNA-binding transcription regulator [Planctomycetaceae bacterium]|nr:DeoR/GlpR family DNA-binding transcription regulator [Planctomycetaceae bacterium]
MAKYASDKRINQIAKLVRQSKLLPVKELAKTFQVSEMTIHRDLNKLQEQGHIERVYGGVLPAEKMEFEFDFANRRAANQKAKRAIAQEALKLINPGSRIVLDNGTTTLELACLLKDHENLTVITPSLAVASMLQFSAGVQTVLLGGILRKGSPDLTGVVTEKVLDMFMADMAFQGADGISLNGELFISDMRIARVDQKMRRRAKQTYILCDSSKIGKTDFASNGTLAEVDALITDSKINPEDLDSLKKTSTSIIIVQL